MKCLTEFYCFSFLILCRYIIR